MLPYLAHTFHLPIAVTYIILLVALALFALSLGITVRRILRRLSLRMRPGWEHVTIEAFESLAIPLLVVGTLDLALEIIYLPRRYSHIVHVVVFGLTLGVVFNFLGKFIGSLFRNLFKSDPAFARMTQPATLFVRALLGFLAIIIFLENVGVSLTAVWTTLGVGSVAIGLALQATLSNFFAGITILADRPVSPGDHILLGPGPGGPGLEGEVVRIGWRATEVQVPTQETAFIPNSLMASLIVLNYSLAGSGAMVNIPVKISAAIDPEKAETLLQNTAKKVAEQLHLPPDSTPDISIVSEVTDPFLQFNLKVPVPRLADRQRVSNELRKEITALYRQGELKAP
jgi:small-conductance mechanosensitive channel